MEACSSAHHWARQLEALGHDVRLIAPQYAKPYVKRNKTDAADAEAICEAVARPNMRFVPIKSVDQQAVLALHRARALLVRQRTQLANAIRGLLGEFGIVAPKGIRRLTELREHAAGTEEAALPDEASAAVSLLFRQLDETQDRIGAVEADILTWHAHSQTSQRLATAPGIGPITATALVAAVGDAGQFDSARRFAAWLGLTPPDVLPTASSESPLADRSNAAGPEGMGRSRRLDIGVDRQGSHSAATAPRTPTGGAE
jgi:transposase